MNIIKKNQEEKKKKGSMENISINLPEIYLMVIELLKKLKRVSSRSGCIRQAIEERLEKDNMIKTRMEGLIT